MPERFFEEVELPQLQKKINGVVFPALLFPNANNGNLHQLSHLTEAIEAHKTWLEYLLHKSGAILFRGFPATSPSDFNAAVEAFDYPEMPYIGGVGLRTKVVGRVSTANESPSHQKIHFHNEMAYASEFPTKIFFFCEVEPGGGGETAIVPGHVIYDKMKERHPEFIQQLEEHGLIYARQMPDEDDPLSLIGRGWKSTFSTDDKSIAEQRAAKMGLKLEWTEKGVYIKTDPKQAIKFDETSDRKTWFNNLAVAYTSDGDSEHYDPNKLVRFGDGKTLPEDAVHECLKIMDEECVAIPWQKGDILLVDNLTVLHSRLPLLSPPRRILASLCK